MRVAVLKGGHSLERTVSLRSGSRVEDALEGLGHDIVAIDAGGDLVDRLDAAKVDVAFIAMHGKGGEDGTVQEILEIMGLPYTGSGVPASIRCMDKVLSKYLFSERDIPTPEFFAFNETAFRDFGAARALPQIERELGFPLVVKPAAQGSALGIKFAADAAAVPEALVAAFSYDSKVVLERYIKGRELAVSVLDTDDGPHALPVVEAHPQEGSYFDFESRYEIGKTEYTCPAKLANGTAAAIEQLALASYRALGCYGFARVDMILAGDDEPYVLEVNAIPGLTETSLLPQAAEAAGISFEGLVARIIDMAMKRSTAAV